MVSTIDFHSINAAVIIDTFLLLLIGIGPKIALVPFLDVTEGMDAPTRGRVIRKMLTTASVVAVLLIVFGGLLTRLLHFSAGALAVAGGIILLIIAVSMVLKSDDPEPEDQSVNPTDPMRTAVYPLAVPYLLNPAGIVVLVTISAEARSFALSAVVIGLLAVVIGLDVAVFHFASRVSSHLDKSRMLVTEKVFGFLLAALAVQLVLNGLAAVGVIHLNGH
jgi:small neutral amino acid transporter SnatA (MarC family)